MAGTLKTWTSRQTMVQERGTNRPVNIIPSHATQSALTTSSTDPSSSRQFGLFLIRNAGRLHGCNDVYGAQRLNFNHDVLLILHNSVSNLRLCRVTPAYDRCIDRKSRGGRSVCPAWWRHTLTHHRQLVAPLQYVYVYDRMAQIRTSVSTNLCMRFEYQCVPCG